MNMVWIINGGAYRFDSVVKARAYAVKLIEEQRAGRDADGRSSKEVRIYSRYNRTWYNVPQDAILGRVIKENGEYYWHEGMYYDYNVRPIYKNGKIRRD